MIMYKFLNYETGLYRIEKIIGTYNKKSPKDWTKHKLNKHKLKVIS